VPECVSNMWMMQTRYMVAGWSQSLAHWRSLSVKTSFRWWMSRKLHIFRKTAGFFGIWRSFYALSKGRICREKVDRMGMVSVLCLAVGYSSAKCPTRL
jgi:hypothetical protein